MLTEKGTKLGILAQWYAEPLNHEYAMRLLQHARESEQRRIKRSGHAYLSPLMQMIASHWLGEPIKGQYEHLMSRRNGSVHAEILKTLIYGQLLMSKRQEGATHFLDMAFDQARLLLRPEDYFIVLKRHRLLASIPLGKEATQGESLTALLTTAAVIERMRAGDSGRAEYRHDPSDTYG